MDNVARWALPYTHIENAFPKWKQRIKKDITLSDKVRNTQNPSTPKLHYFLEDIYDIRDSKVFLLELTKTKEFVIYRF